MSGAALFVFLLRFSGLYKSICYRIGAVIRTILMTTPVPEKSVVRPLARNVARRKWPTTQEFAALHDHARLPWRFFGRFTASLAAGLIR
ncbi:hypothetical protein ACUSIJ_01645 [Pseudochelatococcus sp. B33]